MRTVDVVMAQAKRINILIIKVNKLFSFFSSQCFLKEMENMYPVFPSSCWRALARQLPILYNSEKMAKSVGCKIEDMRSRLCFLYPGIPGCL